MDQDRAGEEAAVGKAALSKIAWRLLPIIAVGYGIAYIDRVNIGFAASTMNADLGFSSAVYGLGGGLFFLAYALMEVPSNLLLERFGARLWLGRIMLTWGLIAAAMMFVRTPWQFYGMRMLLGAAEAGFFPGVIVYLSRWFPVANRSRAVSAFYVAFPLSSVVMGGVAGTLLGLDGTWGLRGWQWLFLLEGLPAVLFSLVIFWKLPSRVEAVPWLSEPEKAWVTTQLKRDVAHHDASEPPRVFRAMSDPVVLLVGLANALFLGTGYAFTLSAPQILGGLTHLNPGDVGYLTAAGGLCGAAAMIGNAWLADRSGRPFRHVIVPMLLVAVGFTVLAVGGSPLVVIIGYLILSAAIAAVNGVFFAMFSGLLSPARLVVGVAAANMLGQFGSFFLPTLWGRLRQGSADVGAGLWLLPISFVLAAGVLCLLALFIRRRAAARVQFAVA